MSPVSAELPDPFADAGPLAAAYAAVDWAATPLGPVEQWSPTLLGAVDVMLHTRFPITLLWGPELVLLYNTGYVQMIGDKHPTALGRACAEVFPEAWEEIGPMLHGVLDGAGATWSEDVLIPLDRAGFLEDTWFTFSYSPVRGIGGRVEGVIDITVDKTREVVTARRLAALARLNERMLDVRRLAGFAPALLGALAEMPDDVVDAELRSLHGPPPAGARLPEPPDDLDAGVLAQRAEGGPFAWVPVCCTGDDEQHRLLVLRLNPRADVGADYVDFVRLLGFAAGQQLDRLVAREAERTLSMTLQESMLSRPRHSSLIDVAVRYLPAAEAAQVGGDWYDAFQRADGATMLVVGDVTGHDHNAAAAMGQVRSLLRATAYLDTAGPARILSSVERAMHGLGVHTLATGIVAELRAASGGVRMAWSNAGHPPPVLLGADGSTALLETTPDLIVGMELGAARDDHEVLLEPGSSVLLFTDGLVERRGEHLDDGLARLLAVVDGAAGISADDLCERVLAVLGDRDGIEDDVAVLVVHVPGAAAPGGLATSPGVTRRAVTAAPRR